MKKLIPECVKDRLIYNKETGEFIWSYDNPAHPRLNGTIAGAESEGYRVIKINGSAFRSHRLAWFIVTGEQPNVIDHINGNGLDNRFCNLRNTTHDKNMLNHSKTTNKSGLPCGVREISKGRFQARLTYQREMHYLGVYDTPDEAYSKVSELKNKLFGEFARAA